MTCFKEHVKNTLGKISKVNLISNNIISFFKLSLVFISVTKIYSACNSENIHKRSK